MIYANKRFAKIAARSHDKLMQLRVQDYTRTHDGPENDRLFRRMIDEGTAFVLEKRIDREGEAPRWNRISVSPRRDAAEAIIGGVAVIVNISDHIRADYMLRESEERFRLIVENARDYAIFMLNTEGRIADWLPGAERVFRWSAEEVRGQPVDITFTADDRPRHRADRRRNED